MELIACEAQPSVECRRAVKKLVEGVRQGNANAVVELSQLAEAGYLLRSEKSSIFSLAPSLKELLRAVQLVNGLDSSHRTLTNDICMELCKNFSKIDDLNFKSGDITKTPGMMSRVVLFSNNLIEIRAHIFEENAQETYIHHHCQAFITTCLSGSYVHRIWSVKNNNSSKYYVHRRKTGGIYSEEVEAHNGELENVLCQPFECGQSLFISAAAHHTVGDSKGKLVTIVVRDKLARKEQVVDILSPTPSIEQPTEAVMVVTKDRDRKAILGSLKDALRTLYTTKLIQEPSQELILSAREANRGIHEILDVVQGMRRETDQLRADYALLLLDLAILLLAWSHYRKNPTWLALRATDHKYFALPNGCTIPQQLTKLGIDINPPRIMSANIFLKPASLIEYTLSLLVTSRQELAALKYILWTFGLHTAESSASSRDLELGATSASNEYLHRDLKLPRFAALSSQEERQAAMVRWICEEKNINFESLYRGDLHRKSCMSLIALVAVIATLLAILAWM